MRAARTNRPPAGIAAGHLQTAAAGLEILADGGSAADAAVAASLASCVAETVMTGLLGGGHAIHLEGATGAARNLDCFVAVPGLGAEPREHELVHLEVPFGIELVHYSVGPASCGVPGLPAGLGALWKAYGRLPWPRLVEPAIALARSGTEFPSAHAACLAMLAPVMTMNEGARIYSPGGSLLETGGRLEQPGLVTALELLAAEGPASAYTGTIGQALLALSEERGGLLMAADVSSYEPIWSEPVEVEYIGRRVLTRSGISGVPETLARMPRLSGLDAAERALRLVEVLAGDPGEGHTTNLVTVDAEGGACVLTSSLGLGSGDFLPGLDLHLNSMLGEADLLHGPLVPGERMASMMAPTFVLDGDGLELAAGAAGGTRLRSALLQSIAGVLDEGLPPQEAVARPRLHPAGRLVHLEPGFEPAIQPTLESAGYETRIWPSLHHYFGGVSLLARSGGAGDPRRNGTVRTIE